MADAELNALTAISTVEDADLLYAEDTSAGIGVKVTMNQLVAYMEQRSRQNNASVSNQVTGTTNVYVAGSDITIPAGRLQAKSKYRFDAMITKAAAGTGAPVFIVEVGTAGTTADTDRLTFTWPASNTAVADEMHVAIYVTFRTVGSGTSAVIEGMLLAEHELTTTGFGGTGLGANIIINATSAGFDSTVANLKIGVSVTPGTGAAWTIRQVWAVLDNLA